MPFALHDKASLVNSMNRHHHETSGLGAATKKEKERDKRMREKREKNARQENKNAECATFGIEINSWMGYIWSMENSQKDIFDLNDTSDLPQELRSELVVNKRDDYEKQLIELFRMAGRELNIDQVQTGYYRKYGEHKERPKIIAKLYNMSRATNSAIESIASKKGVYRLKDNFEE